MLKFVEQEDIVGLLDQVSKLTNEVAELRNIVKRLEGEVLNLQINKNPGTWRPDWVRPSPVWVYPNITCKDGAVAYGKSNESNRVGLTY